MTPEQAQALLQSLQQAVSIVQEIAGDPAADPNAANPDAEMDMAAEGAGDDMATDPNAELESGMMDDDDGFEEGDDDDMTTDEGDDADMGTPNNLHDRVSQLESHTGLKKAATSGLSLSDRLDQLESIHLKQEYTGEDVERIEQLEEKVLGKSATVAAAPETIDLKVLLKAAVEEGRRSMLAEIEAERPTVGKLRAVGKKKTQASLQKSAADDDTIDLKELGFGGALQGLYVMNGVGRGNGLSFEQFDDSDDE